MHIQKILFGSPGTGKSHRVDKIVKDTLHIKDEGNIIKTVFHPEYTYGDFMGKLMPLSRKRKTDKKVEYNYYAGHFLKALARAYRNIINTHESIRISTEVNHVILVIDELNRGNSAAIFGTVFQLLDRDESGWSSYGVSISDLEYDKLMTEIGFENISNYNHYDEQGDDKWQYNDLVINKEQKDTLLNYLFQELNDFRGKPNSFYNSTDFQKDRKIFLPPNFSILATMNTSDNSIYFMDSAFKRRWDWEFIHVKSDWEKIEGLKECKIDIVDRNYKWCDFVDKLNAFIKKHHDKIRKIEDKQIGYWFIKGDGNKITLPQIKGKLMFFVWDSVFNTNKKPLIELLGVLPHELVTFGDFQARTKDFVESIINYNSLKEGN